MNQAPSGTVTFLFTDIAGSTQHWERDRAGMSAALARHDTLLHAAIVDHAGHVFKTVGDAFCAAFARASDALDAALHAQLLLAAEVPDLQVRMALHTGQVEERDGDYFGPSVNRVARLLAVGHGGQVLLSEVTAGLVRDGLDDGVGLRDLGEHRLRDLSRPERVFQVITPGLPAKFPPLASLDARPNNLPLAASSFIGRQRELAALAELLPTVRLLTLTGPGGTGKTRLALQLAADQLPQYPDGAFFADLAPIADAERVPDAVAAALSVREEPGRTLTDTLLDALRSRRMLLVLDNCEHILDAAAHLADALLHAAPGVRLVATSREPLTVPGEVAWPVPPLTLPDPRRATVDTLRDVDAVRLFVERAAAVKPGFAVTNANAPAIAELCARLDGSPLALELAAARVRAFSPEEIAKRLDERFRLLTGGSRVALPRHQTLRACLDWSYDLLSDTERRVLQRLGVFAGRFPLDAAEAVCVDESVADYEVVDAVVNLEARSLVVAEPVGEGTEYRLLETIRAYAREQLAASGGEAATRDRHLAWCLALAETAAPQLTTADAAQWLDALERRHPDLRVALDWGLARSGDDERESRAVRLCVALWRFWSLHSHMLELRERFTPATELARRHGDAVSTAHCLYFGAWPKLVTEPRDPAAADAMLTEALALFLALGMLREASWAHNDLGFVDACEDQHEAAEEHFRAALELKRDWSTESDVAISLGNLAEVQRSRGAFEDAKRGLVEVTSLSVVDPQTRYVVLHNLGNVELRLGEKDEGEYHLREALRMSEACGDHRWTFLCVGSLAGAAVLAGDARRAACLQGAAAALAASSEMIVEPADKRDWDHFTALARECLSPAEWDAAYAEGLAMSEGEAVAYALAGADEASVP